MLTWRDLHGCAGLVAVSGLFLVAGASQVLASSLRSFFAASPFNKLVRGYWSGGGDLDVSGVKSVLGVTLWRLGSVREKHSGNVSRLCVGAAVVLSRNENKPN